MRFLLPALMLFALPAPAQWCPPGYCPPFGVRPVFFAPVYGYSYSSFSWQIYGPPPVVLPPRSFDFADDLPRGGVDLAALRRKLSQEIDDETKAKGRVEAAVNGGDLMVFEPGKPMAKKSEPLNRIPDALPPPAAKPAEKPPTDPAALAKFQMRRGQEAFDAGELGRATERFAAAVAADPKLSEAAFKLAQVRVARGQYAEAVDAIRAGMKANPDWVRQPFRPRELYALNPKREVADAADLEAATADSAVLFLRAHQRWFGGDKPGAVELFKKLEGKELVEAFLK